MTTVRREITGRKTAGSTTVQTISRPVDSTSETAERSAGAGGVGDDLLRGAAEIALFLWGDDSRAAQRRLYHEQDRWPIFRLDADGVFYALKSRLRAHLEAKSGEAEARIVAAANRRAAVLRSPPQRRRRRRNLTTPNREHS